MTSLRESVTYRERDAKHLKSNIDDSTEKMSGFPADEF